MRISAATILALLPLSAAATPAPTPAPALANAPDASTKCDRFGRVEQAAVLRQSGPRVQRLDELPPADLHLTVEREVDGCHQPAIVRENFGGPAFRGR